MQLWTYHPPEFRIDNPQLPGIDPTRGKYWSEPSLCYKAALRKLCEMVATEQFPLWCFTVPDCWILTPEAVVEWELKVPQPQILAFIREPVWHEILCGRGGDWENVIVTERPVNCEKNITAVVRCPRSPECQVTCRGKVVRLEWRKDAESLKMRDHALHQRF